MSSNYLFSMANNCCPISSLCLIISSVIPQAKCPHDFQLSLLTVLKLLLTCSSPSTWDEWYPWGWNGNSVFCHFMYILLSHLIPISHFICNSLGKMLTYRPTISSHYPKIITYAFVSVNMSLMPWVAAIRLKQKWCFVICCIHPMGGISSLIAFIIQSHSV